MTKSKFNRNPGINKRYLDIIRLVRFISKNYTGYEMSFVVRGFLRYTIRPVENELVCNRKGPIRKDPAVEINSI
jgi:hypothetical protein